MNLPDIIWRIDQATQALEEEGQDPMLISKNDVQDKIEELFGPVDVGDLREAFEQR
ncbi:MAG: hypothetical protein J2P37_00275 [Ktedonobacteraceae bacterium]|nr:hypothetical protein [Ktedonobacteraceae bacterium]